MKFLKKRFRGKNESSSSSQKIVGYTSTPKKSLKTGFLSGGSSKNIKKDKSGFWIRFWIAFVIVGIPFLMVSTRFYLNVIKKLPSIDQIENADFNQTTIITDRDGEVLYKLFEENRDYISFDKISENFVNALVATEDQRFRENPGVDRKGTLRAAITDVRYGKTHGGSTITQQVIKNILLTPEKKITRKLKEIILAVQLVGYVEKDISQKYKGLSQNEIDRKVKEKILELYANYIFLGNNTYGVEIASQTYFSKAASDLDVLEGAILAGIPQAPSRYDPYSNKQSLMGGVEVTRQGEQDPVELTGPLLSGINKRIREYIEDSKVKGKDDVELTSYLRGLLEFEYSNGGVTYSVVYKIGRKDIVLARLFDEGYITEKEWKKSFVDGLDYEFGRNSIQIKAPHFVFWVINQLEAKYDQDLLRTGGLTIKTTLDLDAQYIAEQSITDNEQHLKSYNASNSSLVYLDSPTGDVLAYVGSKDFNNDDIDGQVDMIQAKRQPGSTIKPFVYSLGFMNMKMTIDSPIYDIETKIGQMEPANSDGEFKGLMTIKEALAGSRNIPAIKMFLSVGGESIVKNFLKSIGVTNIIDDRDHYGYSLALGSAEFSMMELATAYSHLSAMGKPAKIDPILEVRSSDGSLLYSKEPEVVEQVIPSGVAVLMRKILADKENFPTSWRDTFTAPGITFATKSGTTNVVKNDQKFPRDGWMATYTPTKVLIHRSGNTDGSALASEAYGGRLNSPIWKQFVSKMKAKGLIQDETPEEREIKEVTISTLSGKLSSYATPLVFMKKSLGYIHQLPTATDENASKIQIDTLCNGTPTEFTPPESIGSAWYIKPETIMPDKFDQGDIMTWWKSGGASNYTKLANSLITLNGAGSPCSERELIAELGQISIDLIQPKEGQRVGDSLTFRHQTTSPFTITELNIYIDDELVKTIIYDKEKTAIDVQEIALSSDITPGTHVLKAIIADSKGYTDSRSVSFVTGKGEPDIDPPYLLGEKTTVTKDGNMYNVVLNFGDNSGTVVDGTVTVAGRSVSFKGATAVLSLSTLGSTTYSVRDDQGNIGEGSIGLIYNEPTAIVPEDQPVLIDEDGVDTIQPSGEDVDGKNVNGNDDSSVEPFLGEETVPENGGLEEGMNLEEYSPFLKNRGGGEFYQGSNSPQGNGIGEQDILNAVNSVFEDTE